jgi:hypothetical protein
MLRGQTPCREAFASGIVIECRARRFPHDESRITKAVWGQIPESRLAAILSEFRRLASSRSIKSHMVDLADLSHYFDRSITPFNFLQFTDEQWRRYDNSIIPQNRLRISDYRRLLATANFEVLREVNVSGKSE